VSGSPYPAPAACVEPRLGAEATQALGRALPASVVEHLGVCAACRIERAAFQGAPAGAVAMAPGLRARLRERALREEARRSRVRKHEPFEPT